MSDEKEKPLVFVGIPVYNGEKFIKRRIESILSQSHTNFEILISDNASNDTTPNICKKFEKLDKRISYFRQPKNLGYVENFNYLIKNGRGKYFVIAGVDDLWEPDFLEKNVQVLETNEKIIGSIGKVKFFGYDGEPPKSSKLNLRFKKIIRKQELDVLETHVISCKGDYTNKVEKYLRFNQGSFVYGLFRTEIVQKNIIGNLPAWDLVFILNILQFGDLHVIDEILLHKFAGGLSSNGIINEYKRGEIKFIDMFFPFTFSKWCRKNIGLKFFVKNFDWFFVLGIFNSLSVMREIIVKSK